MRIWDLDPGFLNDKSLLGEHRELHGMFNVITMGKKGYSRHPETIRWKNHIPGLYIRHQLLVSEMALRGFNHYSPLDYLLNDSLENTIWPANFIDQPDRQYFLLKEKYREKGKGRISLPKNTQELWARHKYSTMARSYNDYKRIGKAVADKSIDFSELCGWLVIRLRSKPSAKSLLNSIKHMWGYVSGLTDSRFNEAGARELFGEIQSKVVEHRIQYLLLSTALGELGFWLNHAEYSSSLPSPA